MRHTQRYYRIDPTEWTALHSDSIEDTDIRIEPVEAAYMARPYEDPFDDMSFASFVEKYELVKEVSGSRTNANTWSRVDGNGYIKLRTKAHVVKGTPWIAPDATNPSFCFAEIFLHTAWRELQALPETDEQCLSAFASEQDKRLLTEIRQESSAVLSRYNSVSILKNAGVQQSMAALPESEYVFVDPANTDRNESMVKSTENIDGGANGTDTPSVPWVSERTYTSEDIEKARGFIKNFVKPWMKMQRETRNVQNLVRGTGTPQNRYTYPISDADDIHGIRDAMDDSQWIPFSLAMRQSRRFRASIDNSVCEPMQMIINGEGGSGKSWLIRHIVKDIHNVFGEHTLSRSNSKHVLLLAHQGTAAFNIKGRTISSALDLTSFSRNAFSSPYVPLASQKSGPTKHKRLQEEFASVHLIVIDEFSVISSGMMYWFDQRLREIWPKCSHLLFVGRDIIFTGDAAQLDPVVPYSLSTASSRIRNPIQRMGREIWESIANVCILTSQNRGKNDPEWFAALRRLRQKRPTQNDVALFNSRYFPASQMPTWVSTAKHIAYMNSEVNTANARGLNNSTFPTIPVRSKHTVQLKRLAKQRQIEQETIDALVLEAEEVNSSRDRVVSTSVQLAIGAPVTLTFNMEQSAGLWNGTNAKIYDFMMSTSAELPIVLVQITDPYAGPSFLTDVPSIIPIVPRRVSWTKKSSDLSVFREGLSVRLAYATTVHKVQGLTCPKSVFHSVSIPTTSFAYVALSRVRSRDDIVLTAPLTLDKLSSSAESKTIFWEEEQRVLDIVSSTKYAAQSIVNAMKQISTAHNSSLRPR